MARSNKENSSLKGVIDIDIKRQSNYMIFNNLSEERNWIKRVEEECIKDCLKEMQKN